MTEYAPAAIRHLFDTVKAGVPSAILAGIVGDSAHTYGYHRGRNYVSGNDYSVQTPPDKKGSGEAASALDISWGNASDQYTVSQRLMNAKNDSRMNPIREFFGSTDGRNVCGWDYYGNYAVTSDDSHLWHIHISVLREYADNDAALQGVAQVLIGGSQPQPQPPQPLPPEVEMASGVWGYVDPADNRPHVFYQNTNDHLIEAVRQKDGSWRHWDQQVNLGDQAKVPNMKGND